MTSDARGSRLSCPLACIITLVTYPRTSARLTPARKTAPYFAALQASSCAPKSQKRRAQATGIWHRIPGQQIKRYIYPKGHYYYVEEMADYLANLNKIAKKDLHKFAHTNGNKRLLDALAD